MTSSSGTRPVNSTCPQPQLVAQCDQLVEAVTRADQRERDVVAAELVHDDGGRPHDDVDTVLRAHDADVRGQVTAAPAQLRVGRAAAQLFRVGARADDRDVAGRLAAARIAMSR